MENLFANTGIGKHIIRTHHWGIVLPTLEKAEAFMKTFGLQEDYRGHVKAYDADLIFKTWQRCRCSGIHHSIIRRSDRVQQR